MAGKTYYVSGTGDDKNDGLKQGEAFRTLQKAADLVQAGDTVYVMNGTYTNIYPNILSISDKHGTASAPITFTAYPGHTPVLEAHTNNWNAISITGSSYIVINGLKLVGARDETTLEYALEHKDNLSNPATSGNGIHITFIDDDQKIRSHHITISNNNVSKFPGNGIATEEVDYITVKNNIVSGNAWYSPFGNQGITMLHLWNSDNNVTDYKVVIEGNTSFDNKQLVPWVNAGKVTEGHGIMLDTASVENVAYQGKALISNNVVYNNGGAGIQIFKGENPVDIVNNTTYQNSLELSAGEIFINSAKNVRVVNNIMYASGESASSIANSSNYSFDNNLAYNGVLKGTGSGNILNKDPLFVNAANGDFRLKPGSPAIDGGSNAFNSITKNTPLDGNGDGSVLIDIGAYEAPTNKTPSPEIEVLDGTVDIADNSTTPINFGEVIAGSTVTKTFTIKNTGIAALNLSNLRLPDGFSLVGTLPSTVAAKTSANITVALNTTTGATYTGSFSLTNNDSNESPFNFVISGKVNAPEIEVVNNKVDIVDGSTTPIDFGDADFGSTVFQTFTIKNTGKAPLNLTNLELPDGFSLVGTLPATLAVNNWASLTVALNTKTPGTYGGRFILSNNDPNESSFDFAIKGKVQPAPAPEIQVLNGTVDIADGSTTPIDFGNVTFGSTATKTFTIKNIGTATLNLGNLTLPDGFSLVGTRPYSLAAKDSTNITVALNTNIPTPGTYSGSFSLTNNDSEESSFNFAIKGTVKPPLATEIYLLNGTDSSEYLKGYAPSNKIYGFGGNDNIVGNLGNDQLFGGDGNDTLWGNEGNDLLYGDSSNDRLLGDNGNDTLFGGIGDDQIFGGAGNDWLYGGYGKDVLTGGYGADTFVLALDEGTDSITDFEIGKDKLALSGSLQFGQLLIQQQGSQTFIMNSSDNQVLAKLDNVTASILSAQPSTFITI
ncbi:hemolysin-type calcium-binding region [Nostoc commune NIES-4072]|uniref:Hemolysin-type calcium-binding region n=1 Tax=Nostoc commune NIES-4072 TaxID=2005467 RepID=A0A2R5FNT7_NOSCO|nr:choice-of-anchor D domain-containing protein [Nostoc commune]BBD65392.1 hemolysin-type calcium-binding region [Nostoc commune HK-02]GBG17284.1 hemolysin-type calcium-binding region [Nostoc commune NIES-4072]